MTGPQLAMLCAATGLLAGAAAGWASNADGSLGVPTTKEIPAWTNSSTSAPQTPTTKPGRFQDGIATPTSIRRVRNVTTSRSARPTITVTITRRGMPRSSTTTIRPSPPSSGPKPKPTLPPSTEPEVPTT